MTAARIGATHAVFIQSIALDSLQGTCNVLRSCRCGGAKKTGDNRRKPGTCPPPRDGQALDHQGPARTAPDAAGTSVAAS
jgi:hypothetical protein